ncbi:MAG: Ig-like domain-containing protein [Clostridiales bacterium]|nr:Ig-like domain-containing protein [Clostridiales bacterium]
MKRFVQYLGLLALMLLFSFCINTKDVEAAAKISKTSITLSVNQKKALSVNGTKKTVKWSSSDTSVATVTKKGKVKAKAEGTATITAKAGKKKLTCTVNVKGDYRTLYADFLNIKPSYGYYYILDVNKDGLPELIYMDQGAVYQSVYTVSNGQVKQLGTLSFSGNSYGTVVIYNKSKKALYCSSLIHGTGGISQSLYRVTQKGLKLYKSFIYSENRYYIKNKSVSKSKYTKQCKKYCGTSKLKKYNMLQNTAANRNTID